MGRLVNDEGCMQMKCPSCKSNLIVEGEGKYVKNIYWCDECDNEWVK